MNKVHNDNIHLILGDCIKALDDDYIVDAVRNEKIVIVTELWDYLHLKKRKTIVYLDIYPLKKYFLELIDIGRRLSHDARGNY